MNEMIIAILYGFVSIACAFLIFTWGGAALAKDMRRNYRYQCVSWSLCFVSAGLSMLAANRISIAMFLWRFPDWWFMVGATMVIGGQFTLLGSTAMADEGKHRLWWFGACCVIWTVFCVLWYL